MSRRVPFTTWVLFYVWYAWGVSVQSFVADPARLGSWTPELGVLLIVAVEGALPKREAVGVAIGLALLRATFSADPPYAVFAGYLAIAWTLGALRELLLVDRALARTLLAFVLTLAFGAWLEFAHARADGVGLAWSWAALLRTSTATSIAALVGVPLARRLPGLTPLWQRRFA